MTITIYFHSVSAKAAFINKNSIKFAEILEGSPASITIKDDGIKYENSPYVYAVRRDQ